jgi:hypothetical protein
MSNPFRYFNSSPEVTRPVVKMYVRYTLSHAHASGQSRNYRAENRRRCGT